MLKKEVAAQDDLLICFDFLQLTAVIVQLAGKFFIEANIKRKAERRVYFAQGDIKNYKACVKTYH